VSGRGGMGASGGNPLGQSCSVAQDCSSGHCAAGICCDRACTGPCQQCSTAGVCEMPPDDSVCETIPCPADTLCRDYATSISTNRCKALGQCKTAADCSYVDAPATRVCGNTRGMTELAPATCDGFGNCRGPSVSCGGDGACAIDKYWCCGSTGLSCQVDECGGTPKLGPYFCDDNADCSPGYVCCVQSTVGGSSSICLSPTLCQSDLGGERAPACNPAASPSECAAGTCQLATFAPIGWYVCR